MNPQIHLFFFAHAGGTSMIYAQLKKQLKDSINVILVERPGRGIRYNETLLDNMEELLDDAYSIVSPYLERGKFALMGHSMGGSIAFELAHKISEIHHRSPEHVFISSRNVPHVNRTEIINELSDEKFFERVYNIGGTHQEIFNNEELRSIYLPILRSDFKALERFQGNKNREKINADVSILRGSKEGFDNSQLSEWGLYFNGKCKIIEFEGDHFYIMNNFKSLSAYISKTLLC